MSKMKNEKIQQTETLETLIRESIDLALKHKHEFVTPEHFIRALLSHRDFRRQMAIPELVYADAISTLERYFQNLDTIDEAADSEIAFSSQYQEAINTAILNMMSADSDVISVPLLIRSIMVLENSLAALILKAMAKAHHGNFLSRIIDIFERLDGSETLFEYWRYDVDDGTAAGRPEEDDLDFVEDLDDEETFDPFSPREDYVDNELDEEYEEDYGNDLPYGDERDEDRKKKRKQAEWHKLVICLNSALEGRNPLIGREDELERTIQVLCRKDKNNPLHVGEPGVGKTALVYGLARRINDGDVPEKLKDAKIYMVDLGNLIAGTQFRGMFEKRLTSIMNGAEKEGNCILYIDEIHNLIGMGATQGSLDAANILKPYLEKGNIRFIGSTTYEEFNRHFSKSKGLVRRFQQIDILEPSVEDTVNILTQLKKNYEDFHNVSYTKAAIEEAAAGTARHINDRFLPDKAIDLIDEAGAYRVLHPLDSESQTVDKELVTKLLTKMARIDTGAAAATSAPDLQKLENKILSQVFGQDEAVRKVAEAVLLSHAGLTDDNKPMASLLFVGPTGVGKTEVAKVLAEATGVPLVRLDMSEYAEKHTVAKLIGSPAGYVGYEDGGVLTDAIRKTPNCVLLLDEIEKAHSDIYNILLQVMDYARLTDNRGQHADFRNVVVIMTSNAGAQYAAQSKVGFGNTTTSGQAMMKEVKRKFKPEFLNRLTGTVVFNEMSLDMASRILDKKLSQLEKKLNVKNVELHLSRGTRDYILKKGFSPEYGARELDRVISSELKPLLMKEILFGKLKKGGVAKVEADSDKLTIAE